MGSLRGPWRGPRGGGHGCLPWRGLRRGAAEGAAEGDPYGGVKGGANGAAEGGVEAGLNKIIFFRYLIFVSYIFRESAYILSA